MLQFFLLFIFLFLAYKFLHTTKTQRFNLPPGPSGLPVIGHLHLLKPLIYRHFHNISQQYGPIFTLRFGLRRVVVVSSYPLVRKCFTGQNDIVLSNRPCSFTSKYVSYNNTTIGTIPYGDNWRNLRRICSLEILSSHRLATFLDIRRDEIRRMVRKLSRDNHTKNLDDSFKEVEIEPVLSDLTFNNIVRMVTGKRYYGVENDHNHEEEEAKMFKKLIKDLLENSGANQPSDYLPFLKFFGSKYEKKVKEVGECVDKFLQRLLDECRRNREENKNTMINHLMSLQDQEPEYYSDVTIKGLMMGMIIPGTDTASITIGWAMANLLNHRNILNKARQEIDEKIGQDRLLDELDIPNLPYLQNIVSETFRLYPVGPVLVPREAAEDIKIGQYDVPRGTILLVNAWAIHHDPDLWDDPEIFCPERFNSTKNEESDDVRKLMPFGNGRRMCPAAGLGQRIVSWALGALVQCFDWENVNGEKIDMEESEGIAMRKLRPLRAMCRSRPVMSKLTCQFTSID